MDTRKKIQKRSTLDLATNRYIRLADRWHQIRESDGSHHLTVCGKYVQGVERFELPGPLCVGCARRFDVGFMVDANPEPVAAALTRGRGSWHRQNGRRRIRES